MEWNIMMIGTGKVYSELNDFQATKHGRLDLCVCSVSNMLAS